MFTRFIALAALLLVTVAAGAPPVIASASVPSDDGAVMHALNRLTYGPRPGDVERVQALGLQRWIETQLNPSRIGNSAVESRLARLETLAVDPETIQREYAGPAMRERRQRAAERADAGQPRAAEGTEGAETSDRMQRDQMPGSRRQISDAQRKDRQVIADIEEAKLLRAIYSERQLEEVLVDFWFNHFNVFAGKGATRNYLGQYEREAIRPHVFGSFRAMLEATAKHPAMLFYLDNWLSASAGDVRRSIRLTSAKAPALKKPDTTGSPRRARGINENYARELLELHTLGVDGGYTQEDIVNVARAFTGWTMQPRQGSGFMFVARLHDGRDKKVLGQTIRDGGIDEGERVLDIVAAHPSTARHIATKLAIRFVSDTPPAALVDRAAARFTATRGDLREVVKTIVTSPEFFAAGARQAKVKTPLEFVASALRATDADVRTALPLARTLRDMGMPLYFCQPPTGYGETATTWVSAGALVGRMNFAVALSKSSIRGIQVPLTEQETLALKLGSPEFQRQ